MVTETLTKKANHQANVVRIETILPHPDPETTNLELIHIGEYQVVVRKGEFKVGDLAVYIQPDSVVPQTEVFRFIWEQHYSDEFPTVPERRRRITVRRFRKEWSEGLLLPLSDFQPEVESGWSLESEVGEDVSELIGITHYNPDKDELGTKTDTFKPKNKIKYPKTLKGWFYFILYRLLPSSKTSARIKEFLETDFPTKVYDVESFKHYANTFEEGEPVIVTEKIHGSNARYVTVESEFYTGSHYRWTTPESKNIFREAVKQNPWIQTWCDEHPCYTLYGEVTPTQTNFEYGNKKGQVTFFLFDILSPDGSWLNDAEVDEILGQFEHYIKRVPVLWAGKYNKDLVKGLADGVSHVVGAKHIREGVVVKSKIERNIRGLGRAQLKIVSNTFLQKDSK